MECGFGLETAGYVDDFWGVDGGAGGDDFFVDELLDFSHGFSETEEKQSEDEKEQDKEKACCISQDKQTIEPENDFVTVPETELSVPAEGLESLEWLSHFVEDSFSDYPFSGKLAPKPAENGPAPAVPSPEQPCFTTPVHTKARTKRDRTGVRVWPVRSPSSSTSCSSPTSSTTLCYPPNILSPTEENPVDNKVKKKAADKFPLRSLTAQPKRCSHCGVTKTPQWRAGPLGSKTLCNACGVRFKSGRLMPEYRPACSPTFSSELHSNNHRKVLEMRRKKEMEIEAAGSEFLKS